MANTYTLIGSSTATSGAVSYIDFTSIPGTYTDLLVKASLRINEPYVSENFYIQFNGTTTNLTYKQIIGVPNAGTVSSNSSFPGYANGSTSTSNTFGNLEIYIPNYTSTSTYKSFSSDTVNENNTSEARPALAAGLWSSNSAITSIRLISDTGATLLQYSSAYLYGIKKS